MSRMRATRMASSLTRREPNVALAWLRVVGETRKGAHQSRSPTARRLPADAEDLTDTAHVWPLLQARTSPEQNRLPRLAAARDGWASGACLGPVAALECEFPDGCCQLAMMTRQRPRAGMMPATRAKAR